MRPVTFAGVAPQSAAAVAATTTLEPAENLIKGSGSWKVLPATTGQDVEVTLRLDEPVHVAAVELQNDGSAFVEVLVGKSSWMPGELFQPLVAMTTLMSPAETAARTNARAQRTFAGSALVPAAVVASAREWDLVRIVCRQPYGAHLDGFGLARIALSTDTPSAAAAASTAAPSAHAPGTVVDADGAAAAPALGAFKLRTSAAPGPSGPAHLLFRARQTAKDDAVTPSALPDLPPASVPASLLPSAIARAPPPLAAVVSTPAALPAPAVLQAPAVVSAPATATVSARVPAPVPAPAPIPVPASTKAPAPVPAPSPAPPPVPPQTKATAPTKAVASAGPSTALKDVLVGVRFAISGIQNPERAQLRDQAAAMGAHYQADVAADTTHLIGPVADTPKHQRLKQLCWGLTHPRTPPSAEAELGQSAVAVLPSWITDCFAAKRRLPETTYLVGSALAKRGHRDTSDQDDDDDDAGDSTASGPPAAKRVAGVTALPDLLKDVHVFFYKMDGNEQRRLGRLVIGYGGHVDPYMGTETTHAVTSLAWDRHFDAAADANPGLQFVTPAWLDACHREQRAIDPQRFQVQRRV